MHKMFQPRIVARARRLSGCLAVGLAALVVPASAQQAVMQPRPSAQLSSTPLSGIIDVQADDLSYDAVHNRVIAQGNVKVARGTDSVAADYAEIDTATEQVSARGHIVIQYQGNIWKGDEATYNFKTGTGDFGAFEAYVPPYHLTAVDSRRLSPRMTELKGVMLTTCEPDDPEYSIRASSATLEGRRIIRAKNVRFHLGPVPFFWFPYVKADLDAFANFEFTPGYSSEMGVFLLTAYNYPVNDVFKTHTHFDVRQKRGIGLGENLSWKDPAGSDYAGKLRLYYADDRNPWHDEDQRVEREALIDHDRYWIHLEDRHSLTDRDYLITGLNYVSDPWMLADFFDDEYQNQVQPENRVTLSHRADHYTAGVGLNMSLNDFYGNVNRLPEVFLNFNRQQILDTPLFYEGQNTLSYLDRVFPDGSGKSHYDAFRLDSAHMVYWPTHQFGFLSLIPRAGYRGTYYSKTLVRSTVTNVVTLTNESGVVIGTTNVVAELVRDEGAVWRNLPELGAETSFKAFGDLYRGPTGIEEDEDLRHIAEPYANYTLRFDPNVPPEELWQFDAIDKLDRRNDVKVGLRNYLQTKRKNAPHNLVYADVFTTLLLAPEDDEKTMGDIGFKSELRPWSWFLWDFNGAYDTRGNSIRTFSTQAQISNADLFTFGLDYRYARDTRDQVAGDFTLFPEQPWSFRIYARMNIEDSFVEEHSYYIVHRTRCLGIGLGLRVRPEEAADGKDNYTVWFRIWPLALSGFSSSIGG
jgi:lipopolysaccharide assembly outer membrane protein LptD (OstA)